ncbi:MAG: succinate dehydrogenase assembly factor 2 [Methylococcales bacterium]|nr:succinate dehydrogenase assembly factor 2 [Methylococcaceae bacterium]HIL39767.1 succinate dehydrogenase assembly factor 2 [Methylococcales bacterium]
MAKLAKLKWRCRRGSLELDRLLMSYLEQNYQNASDQERLAFEALVALEDLALSAYLFGAERPACPTQAQVIKKIVYLRTPQRVA